MYESPQQQSQERFAVEQQLRQSHATLDAIIKASPLAVIALNHEGRVKLWNAAAERMLGWKAEEVIDRLPPHVRPDDRDQWLTVLAQELQGNSYHSVEHVRQRRDGTLIDVMIWTAPLHSEVDGISGAVHVLADISERKQQERQLEESRAILQSVVDFTTAVIYLRDAQGRFRLVNRHFEEVYGVPQAMAWAMTPAEIMQPNVAAALEANDRLVLETGRPLQVEEVLEHDGQQRTYLSIKFPVRDANGQITAMGSIATDITDRKRMEEHTKQLNTALEERVAARTSELEGINRELAERNRENELFVFSVSHDLRSPLVNLQGFSEELRRSCQELRTLAMSPGVPPPLRDRAAAILDGDVTEAVHYISSAVTSLSNIMAALLRLSRAGRVEYHLQLIDMQPLLQHIVTAQASEISRVGAEVTVCELLPACGDPIAVEQIFANLLQNALRYHSRNRSPMIEIGMVDVCNPVAGADNRRGTEDQVCTYYVRDNGLGIPAALHPKVFQAFQRLHPGSGPGEGMGLALVRRIIDRHGGQIWFESIEGSGTTFYVSLLAQPAQSQPEGKE